MNAVDHVVLGAGAVGPAAAARGVPARGRFDPVAGRAPHKQLGAIVLTPFVRQRLGTFIAKDARADLDALRELIEIGAVSPVVDRVVALDHVPDAIRDPAAGHAASQDRHRNMTSPTAAGSMAEAAIRGCAGRRVREATMMTIERRDLNVCVCARRGAVRG